MTLRKIQDTVHAIRQTIAHDIEGKSLKQITAKYNKNANTRLNTFRGFEKVTTHFLRKVMVIIRTIHYQINQSHEIAISLRFLVIKHHLSQRRYLILLFALFARLALWKAMQKH